MKKNKLYTVNKWNKPSFLGIQNLFYDGGTTGYANNSYPGSYDVAGYKAAYTGGEYGQNTTGSINTGSVNTGNGNTSGTQGNPTNGSSGAGQAIASMALQAADTPFEVNGRYYKHGIYDYLDPGYHAGETTFSDGTKAHKETGIGNAFGDMGVQVAKSSGGNGYVMAAAGALKATGDIINNGWGMAYNDNAINAIKETDTKSRKVGNAIAGTDNTDDFFDAAGYLTAASGYKSPNEIVKGGIFKKGSARREGQRYLNQEKKGLAYQGYGVGVGAKNTDLATDDEAMSNYVYAYGGPFGFNTNPGALGLMQQNRYFDTIDKRSEAIAGKGQTMQTNPFSAKTFAGGGGLEAAFLDNFGSDPIGAAVRYNQGLEALAAQEEAMQAEAAREAEYLAIQQRLANLETENQGLQALMAAQTQNPLPTVPEVEEAPTSSSTTSVAAPRKSSGNSNWDYIKDQLKKSGKFNDIQIEGIKYNLQRESSIDPTAVGDGGAAFGLGQWHGKRQPKDRSLEGQTKHLIDTLSNFDGKEHWIGKGNYEGFMNARTPEEAHYYITKGYERPQASIVAKVKRDSDMSLKRMRAFGGELGTNGTDFTNGLLYIDEGGTHEDNPLDGVPMGLDPQGVPNLVEEGETVYNDYVFSDRMNVPFFMYKELGLGGVVKKKGKGMSFADASKKLAMESEKRPNDPISKDGLNASLSRLAEIQETERMKKQAEEYMGLEEYACGGKMNKYATGGKKGNMFWGWGEQINQFVPWWPQTTAPSVRLTPAEMKAMAEKQIAEKKAAEKASRAAATTYRTTRTVGRDSNNPYGNEVVESRKTPLELKDLVASMGNPSLLQDPTKTPINPKDVKIEGSEYLPGDERYVPETAVDTYPTWMRYAPAVGTGFMALTDMLGLTNKPDYTMADKIEAAAERAGYAPQVEYTPIGNYLQYNPMDIWVEQNRLNANSRATDRALLNNSSPIGTRMAGLLANGYNNQIASGELYRKALEYNDAKRKDVAGFNRTTDMFNSQMGLEAAMANARYHQAAQQLGLSGLAQAAALRDQIDARIGAAKSANLSNFLTNLGNIGRENFAMNQINTDRSRNYYGNLSGNVGGYKRKKKSSNNA